MKTRSPFRWLIRAAALALSVAAVAATAQATSGTSATAAAQGNAVTDWNLIAQNAIVVGRPVGSSLVLEGIVQAAIYDATIAVEGGRGRHGRAGDPDRPGARPGRVRRGPVRRLSGKHPGRAGEGERDRGRRGGRPGDPRLAYRRRLRQRHPLRAAAAGARRLRAHTSWVDPTRRQAEAGSPAHLHIERPVPARRAEPS